LAGFVDTLHFVGWFTALRGSPIPVLTRLGVEQLCCLSQAATPHFNVLTFVPVAGVIPADVDLKAGV